MKSFSVLLCLFWYGAIVLNLTGHLDLPWALLLAPLWGLLAFAILVIAATVFVELAKLCNALSRDKVEQACLWYAPTVAKEHWSTPYEHWTRH